MSLLKANAVQLGQSLTASQNFTWYQPASPDGTVRLGNGNSGSVTDLVTLTSAGNLGIGTSSPAQVLDVQKAQAWVTATSTTGTNSSVFKTANTGGSSYFGRESSAGTVFGGGAYATVVYGSGAYPMSFFTNDTKQMTLDSSGNLGLGVTPSGWSSFKAYQVNRASVASIGADTYFSHNWYWSGSADTYIASDYATRYSQQSGQHRWWTAPSGTAGNAISFTQAMTLDASGHLLVGTTTTPGTCALVLSKDSGTTRWQVGPAASSGATLFYITATSASQGVYLASTTATSWTGLSDERYKDIIEPISNAIDKVNSLRTVIGKFKDDETETRRSFLIAQDVQAVLPEAVDASDPDKLGVAYTDTIPLLVAAIKELSAELNELKQKVNA